ncbi:MAG TPA: LLM class F420-dependent oxidoreductase [Anaerolineales bacterium]|nr:LLM class F420-dependent oxidoreductase [Anaerolineales bacterium]
MNRLNLGVVYPQTEYPSDPSAIRDYAQTVEGIGYSHILAYDHVLGANPERPGGWRGPYTYQHPFQEPLVLFSYMSALTEKIGFTTGIIILPQRQTALVAKQAAVLDVLCGGRLRFGVGLGWNEVEFSVLGQEFHNRGRRIEEQIDVLRRLWTQPLVEYQGRWHTIPDAGINPLPIQRPIPIWFGGNAERALQRMARLGDGWMPIHRSPADAKPALEQLDRFLEENGRDRSSFGLEARLPYGDGNPDVWRNLVEGWKAVGATHLSLNTMAAGFDTPAKHLQALEEFARQVDFG